MDSFLEIVLPIILFAGYILIGAFKQNDEQKPAENNVDRQRRLNRRGVSDGDGGVGKDEASEDFEAARRMVEELKSRYERESKPDEPTYETAHNYELQEVDTETSEESHEVPDSSSKTFGGDYWNQSEPLSEPVAEYSENSVAEYDDVKSVGYNSFNDESAAAINRLEARLEEVTQKLAEVQNISDENSKQPSVISDAYSQKIGMKIFADLKISDLRSAIIASEIISAPLSLRGSQEQPWLK